MLKHRSRGRQPQLTFTSDFHELVQGDLIPGPCVLRYDPRRIVPGDEILNLPASQQPVIARINFQPLGENWEGELRLRPGTAVDPTPDPTGHGTMLGAQFPLAEGCQELEIWFSFTDAAGQTHWDSNHGTNFWLRFPTHDLKLMRAEVVPITNSATGQFEVEVHSIPEVEAINLRWRLTQFPTGPRRQCALVSSNSEDGDKLWTAPKGGIVVSTGAVVAFDLVYFINGRKYTDDNQGTWFLS